MATVFIAVTDDDCTNICAAQIAKKVFHIEKVVARIYDEEKIPLVTGMEIDTILFQTIQFQAIRLPVIEWKKKNYIKC